MLRESIRKGLKRVGLKITSLLARTEVMNAVPSKLTGISNISEAMFQVQKLIHPLDLPQLK